VGSARVGSTETWRRSRLPAVRARLTRILNNHVLNEERPSKRCTPFTTAIQVSWATSSAAASLSTWYLATRTRVVW
jgi:hypothetical protein